MTTIAIFTVGADVLQVKNMEDFITKNSGKVDKYVTAKHLLEHAKRGRFSYVLVIDYDALDRETVSELRKMRIEVISFKERNKLYQKLMEEVFGKL